MSADEVAAKLNEVDLGAKTTGLYGLLLGIAIKYGLPSLVCIWLFYVIYCKDQQIFTMAQQTTEALVESNHAKQDLVRASDNQAQAIRELADAVAKMNK